MFQIYIKNKKNNIKLYFIISTADYIKLINHILVNIYYFYQYNLTEDITRLYLILLEKIIKSKKYINNNINNNINKYI